jgi:hypothetical protein
MKHFQFDFGRVKFMEANVRALTLKNLSKYPVAFKFVKHDRSNAAALRSDWLTVTPDAQRIDKGCEVIYSRLYSTKVLTYLRISMMVKKFCRYIL